MSTQKLFVVIDRENQMFFLCHNVGVSIFNAGKTVGARKIEDVLACPVSRATFSNSDSAVLCNHWTPFVSYILNVGEVSFEV